ncbi:hypothetical protein T4B_14810 [Trichinella pseudospiralis]|uniref:Uncharacterized protein n=1 Tax=Trichinella pseudospiralis TaxID=6337 RepID=A0A0V1GII8_TRIPS|nr:hypothetical protein T4B_14810 [Trichinella pseudospiralis]
MLQTPRLICSRTTHTIYVERVYFVLSTPTCQTACDYGSRNLKAGFICDTFQPF